MNHSRKQAPHKGIIYVTPNKSASLKKNSQISPIKVGVFFLLVAMFMINLWLRLGLPGYYSPIEPITPIDATQEYVESRVDQPKDDTLCINHPQLGLPCEFPNKPGVQGMMLCPADGRVPVCQEMPARKLAKHPKAPTLPKLLIKKLGGGFLKSNFLLQLNKSQSQHAHLQSLSSFSPWRQCRWSQSSNG